MSIKEHGNIIGIQGIKVQDDGATIVSITKTLNFLGDIVVTDVGGVATITVPTSVGDMQKATYDPTGKNGDAFSMGNMDETATNKIFSDVERTKLAGIEALAQKNVQSDRTEGDNTKDSYIKNKPAIGTGDMEKTTYDPAGVNEQLVGETATQTLTNKSISADQSKVTDAGGYFQGNNVEEVLQEIGETRRINGFNQETKINIGKLFWDNATREFKIDVKPTETEYNFWANNKKFTYTTPKSVILPNVTDEYYIYFDNAGVLQLTTLSGLPIEAIYEYALVGFVYYNATTGEGLPGDERHGKDMSSTDHLYEHSTYGARLNNLGGRMDIQGLVNLGTTYTQTISGSFWDEDIHHLVDPQNTHTWLYRLGTAGEWTIGPVNNEVGLKIPGDTYYSWNKFDGTTWTLEEGTTSTDFFVNFMFAVPGLEKGSEIKIPGQNAYPNKGEAQDAILDELGKLQTDGLPSPEMVALYAFITKRNGKLQKLSDGKLFLDLRDNRGGGSGGSSIGTLNAIDVPTDTSNFNNNLSSADTDVQKALDTIDNMTGGGGHTIQDEGSALAQRANLNFKGFNVSDDNANNATIIEVLGGSSQTVFLSEPQTLTPSTNFSILHNLNVTQSDVESGRYDVFVSFNIGGSSGKGYYNNRPAVDNDWYELKAIRGSAFSAVEYNWSANSVNLVTDSSNTFNDLRVHIIDTRATGIGYQKITNDKGYVIFDSTLNGTTPVIINDSRIDTETPINVYFETEPTGNITKTINNGNISIVSDNAGDTMDFRIVAFNMGTDTYITSDVHTLNGAGPRTIVDGNIDVDTPVNLFPIGTPAGYLTIEAQAGQVVITSTATETNLDVKYIAFTELSTGSILDGAYGASWNGDTSNAPSRNAVYDKIESIVNGESFIGDKNITINLPYIANNMFAGGDNNFSPTPTISNGNSYGRKSIEAITVSSGSAEQYLRTKTPYNFSNKRLKLSFKALLDSDRDGLFTSIGLSTGNFCNPISTDQAIVIVNDTNASGFVKIKVADGTTLTTSSALAITGESFIIDYDKEKQELKVYNEGSVIYTQTTNLPITSIPYIGFGCELPGGGGPGLGAVFYDLFNLIYNI